MGMGRDIKDGAGGLTTAAILTILGVVLVVVVMLVGTFAFGWFSNTTADFRGGVDQRNLTNGNGQYRIAQYDDFHNRCNALIAAQGQIDQDADPANAAGLPASIAATNKAADIKSYRDQATDYNAKASQTATAGQFRDSQLPYSVPTTYQPNGDKITCSS